MSEKDRVFLDRTDKHFYINTEVVSAATVGAGLGNKVAMNCEKMYGEVWAMCGDVPVQRYSATDATHEKSDC
jgi:hypothetical protein